MDIIKVAIMGAGLSGLSCAITLEKHGVKPVIFEKRDMVGDRFICGEAMFNIFNKPVNSCLSYLEKKHGILLKPVSSVNRVTFHSKNESSVLNGSLGISNIRGRHDNSFENQLLKQVKSDIHYNSEHEYEELSREFDYVVLATGDGAYSQKLGNYIFDLGVTLKGTTIEGDFREDYLDVWFSDEFAPLGYAYLIPYSKREANITIAYPDYKANQNRDLHEMWDLFYHRVEKDLGQKIKITDGFQVKKYMIGRCKKPKIDNTYFTGNCFGAISPAFGFGQFASILTGIYAAIDICGEGNYEKLVKRIYTNYENSLVLRKTINHCDDDIRDRALKVLNTGIVKQITEYLCGTKSRFEALKWLSNVLRIWNRLNKW